MQDTSMGKSATPDVMTLKDVAAYLQVSLRQAQEVAHLPGFPVVFLSRTCWRVPRWMLDAWLSERVDPLTPRAAPEGKLCRSE